MARHLAPQDSLEVKVSAPPETSYSSFVRSAARRGPARCLRTEPARVRVQSKHEQPGELTLIAEGTRHSLLHNADNIIMAPWGDLMVCEDTASHCGIVGVDPDGNMYEVADNAYSDSELADACFSPDGTIMFVNIQYPGMTLAITGPWPT